MENPNENTDPEQEQQEHYVPRPAWQVWLARVGLVLFLAFVAYQIALIARGGL